MKLRKTIVLLFLMFFVKTSNVLGIAFPYSKAIVMENTTPNVSLEIVKKQVGKYYYFSELRYTISEDATAETIIINAGDDIIKALNDKTYMPGDAADCKITIINNSSNKYYYVPHSFYISTEDYTKYYENKMAKKLSDLAVGFDGNFIPESYTIRRTSNSAIKALFGKEKPNLTDSGLDLKLKNAGYLGIEELNKYYLNYYNDLNNLKATKLADFPKGVINQIFGGYVNLNVFETNPEIATLSYNYFYNYLLSVSPKSVTSYNDKYSIGNLMNEFTSHKNESFEKIYQSAFASLKHGEEKTAEGFVMNLNFYDTSNAYQNYNYGFTLGFKLELKKGIVVAHYETITGEKLLEDQVETGIENTAFHTYKKNIAGYRLVNIKGQEKDVFSEEQKDVYYIYEKDNELEVISEIMPPNTGV